MVDPLQRPMMINNPTGVIQAMPESGVASLPQWGGSVTPQTDQMAQATVSLPSQYDNVTDPATRRVLSQTLGLTPLTSEFLPRDDPRRKSVPNVFIPQDGGEPVLIPSDQHQYQTWGEQGKGRIEETIPPSWEGAKPVFTWKGKPKPNRRDPKYPSADSPKPSVRAKGNQQYRSDLREWLKVNMPLERDLSGMPYDGRDEKVLTEHEQLLKEAEDLPEPPEVSEVSEAPDEKGIGSLVEKEPVIPPDVPTKTDYTQLARDLGIADDWNKPWDPYEYMAIMGPKMMSSGSTTLLGALGKGMDAATTQMMEKEAANKKLDYELRLEQWKQEQKDKKPKKWTPSTFTRLDDEGNKYKYTEVRPSEVPLIPKELLVTDPSRPGKFFIADLQAEKKEEKESKKERKTSDIDAFKPTYGSNIMRRVLEDLGLASYGWDEDQNRTYAQAMEVIGNYDHSTGVMAKIIGGGSSDYSADDIDRALRITEALNQHHWDVGAGERGNIYEYIQKEEMLSAVAEAQERAKYAYIAGEETGDTRLPTEIVKEEVRKVMEHLWDRRELPSIARSDPREFTAEQYEAAVDTIDGFTGIIAGKPAWERLKAIFTDETLKNLETRGVEHYTLWDNLSESKQSQMATDVAHIVSKAAKAGYPIDQNLFDEVSIFVLSSMEGGVDAWLPWNEIAPDYQTPETYMPQPPHLREAARAAGARWSYDRSRNAWGWVDDQNQWKYWLKPDGEGGWIQFNLEEK